MNTLPKHVASTTLEEPLQWQNSSLLHGDVGEAIGRLRQQPGRDILMYSSGELMHTLMEQDLIDEYRLWIHPVVLGRGKRLFEDGIAKTELKLVRTTELANDVLVLTYRPAGRADPSREA